MQALWEQKRVKNGYVNGKQRWGWGCNDCGKTYRGVGDLREKHTNEHRLSCVKWYLEGVGIMAIERMEGVPSPLVYKQLLRFTKFMFTFYEEYDIYNLADSTCYVGKISLN